MVFKKKRKEYRAEDWTIYPWPEPKPGQKYGPTPMQEQLFIYHYKPWERPHYHGVDIVLMVGGRGSGKSLACIAEIIELVASYPKCAAVVGGVDMPLLKRNVMDLFGERLSWKDADGIMQPWEHPLVLKPPPEKTPVAPMINGATIRFLNIGEALKVRGFTADIFMIEEVNLLDGSSLKEMFGRSRGRALPIRQFILNMNPTGTRDWVYDMFALKQFEKTYEGPALQIGDICKCEFCEVCMAQELGEFKWVGGEKKYGPDGEFYEWTGATCPNPNCANIAATTIYEKNGKVKKLGTCARKDSTCPGAQNYYRVIRSASFDNPHNPSDFVQLQKGAMSKEEFETYVKGEIVDLNTGFIYKEFSSANIAPVEFDPEKDIYWTMDFNKDPMCSQIVQDDGDVFNVVDEFTLWNADERDVAKAFCERYKGYRGTVKLHGDPNGIVSDARADSTKTSFVFLLDYLRKNGFKVQMGFKKIKGDTLIPIPTRVNTLKAALKNVDGVSRIKIDPKCINLIESLRHTKWKENSKSPHEDENCDANAKLNPRRYEQAVLMTHPQAALGYLVVREKKLLLDKAGVKIMITEGTTIIGDAKEIKVEKRVEVPAPPPEEPQEEDFSISNLCGFGGSSILQERMEYERQQAEEYKRRRSG